MMRTKYTMGKMPIFVSHFPSFTYFAFEIRRRCDDVRPSKSSRKQFVFNLHYLVSHLVHLWPGTSWKNSSVYYDLFIVFSCMRKCLFAKWVLSSKSCKATTSKAFFLGIIGRFATLFAKKRNWNLHIHCIVKKVFMMQFYTENFLVLFEAKVLCWLN